MKTKNLILGALLSMGITNISLAGGLCGDGTYDPIVGQYISIAPNQAPGLDPSGFLFNNGGTASYHDVGGIGAQGSWVVGNNSIATGTMGTVQNITWKKIGNRKYAITRAGIFGAALPLAGSSGASTFPTGDQSTGGFKRGVIKGIGTLSNDCSSLTITVQSACIYDAAAIDLANGQCVPVSQLGAFNTTGKKLPN